jgi:hypothetical protein
MPLLLRLTRERIGYRGLVFACVFGSSLLGRCWVAFCPSIT